MSVAGGADADLDDFTWIDASGQADPELSYLDDESEEKDSPGSHNGSLWSFKNFVQPNL